MLGTNGNGRVGIGTSSPFATFTIDNNGSILVDENKLATTTSMTIDWQTGNQQLIQLGTSATTLTHSRYVRGQTLRLVVCNPGGTAGALTWAPAGTILWPAGTAPTQTTTANVCDIWSFIATEATSTVSGVKILGAQTANF